MDLPEYTSRALARSPLVLVATQINFEDVGGEVTHAQAREMQNRLGPRWSQLQSAPQMKTTMTPAGAVNEPNRSAYRLLNADASWAALLNPDSVTLETRSYPGWDDMLSTIESFARAIADVYDPGSEVRLGLRYVDQVPCPDGREGWNGLIPDPVLCVVNDPRFADGVLGSDQRVLLEVDDQVRCIFRYMAGLRPIPTNRYQATYLTSTCSGRTSARILLTTWSLAQTLCTRTRADSFGRRLRMSSTSGWGATRACVSSGVPTYLTSPTL